MKGIEIIKCMDTKLYDWLKDQPLSYDSAYTIIWHRWPYLIKYLTK